MKYFVKILLIALIAVVASCKETLVVNDPPELPDNPYDTIQYKEDGSMALKVDSNGFLGIHTYILQTKCAQPACHDGAFEPDFRTVQSSYSTLVYHPVLKDYPKGNFEYRVVPFDTQNSWMHERLTTNDPVLGRMPLYDTLLEEQIALIENWILTGAKDIFGNEPELPNTEPAPFGIVAYENDVNGMRLDTNRARITDPMIFPKNQDVDIWFGLYDDVTVPPLFKVNKVRFSESPFDFSNAIEKDLIVETQPHYAPSFAGIAPYFLHVKFNTSELKANKTYYMRVYVQDADHSYATEIPEDGAQLFLFMYFSFKAQ